MAENDQDLEVVEPDEVEVDEVEENTAEETETDEVSISIGDEESTTSEVDEEIPEDAPKWVKDTRKRIVEVTKTAREATQRADELERQLKAKEEAVELPQLGEDPTLESCDFDTDVFKEKWRKWTADKAAHDAKIAEKAEVAKKANEAFQTKLRTYHESKAKLKVKDFAEAEANVLRKFDQNQQGIIVNYAKQPELLVYALGKNEKVSDELASIKDPIKYAFAVAELEIKLKVTPRKAPAPESKLSGSGSQGTADATLARLRAEAEKTGNYTKVVAYKNQLKK
jgi:hypothetical protein